MRNKDSNPGSDCEIYQRFLENKYSRDDVAYIIKHQLENVSDKSLIRICKDYWYHHFLEPVEAESKSDFESMLDRIHHKLNLVDDRPMSPNSSGRAAIIIKITLRVYYCIAAIIVLGLILTGMFNYVKNETFMPEGITAFSEVTAPMGSRIKVDLPDGSTAWLNHGSILRYPQKYGRKSRETFISGEAYFNVKEEKHRSFILKTSDVDIHVLGTSFNVMTYEEDNDIEITLETGKVELYSKSTEKSSKRIGSLKPGERIIFNKESGKISKQFGNTDVFTSWKDNTMIFRDEPLDIIAKKLGRWYNVEIELSDQILAKYRFTATFTDETLPQVLHLLSVAVPIEYTISSRVKQFGDSYSKPKVEINAKK